MADYQLTVRAAQDLQEIGRSIAADTSSCPKCGASAQERSPFKECTAATERFLDLREDVVIAAVQVRDRLAALLDELAIRVEQRVIDGDDGVLEDAHGLGLQEPDIAEIEARQRLVQDFAARDCVSATFPAALSQRLGRRR